MPQSIEDKTRSKLQETSGRIMPPTDARGGQKGVEQRGVSGTSRGEKTKDKLAEMREDQPTKPASPKPKCILIGVAALILVTLCAVVFVYLYQRPIKEFDKYIAQRDWAQAKHIYDTCIAESESQKERLEEYLIVFLEEQYDAFQEESLSYDELMEALNFLRQLPIVNQESISGLMELGEKLENSHIAYHQAQPLLDEGDYMEAYRLLSAVIPEDSVYYEETQKLLPAIGEEAVTQAVRHVDSLLASDKPYEAQAYLLALAPQLDSTEIRQQKQAISRLIAIEEEAISADTPPALFGDTNARVELNLKNTCAYLLLLPQLLDEEENVLYRHPDILLPDESVAISIPVDDLNIDSGLVDCILSLSAYHPDTEQVMNAKEFKQAIKICMVDQASTLLDIPGIETAEEDTSFYVGQMNEDDKLDGYGVMYQNRIRMQEGTWQDGSFIEGYHAELPIKNGVFTGEVSNGVPINGMLIYYGNVIYGSENKTIGAYRSSYTGYFQNGIPNGKEGIMRWRNGALYKGIVEDGWITDGTVTWSDGRTYRGTFASKKAVFYNGVLKNGKEETKYRKGFKDLSRS
jgi:hypothetical protein